jgi:hypothetical protein
MDTDARTPQTCREWYAMHAAGYEPRTTVEIGADDVARVRCGTLTLLTRVKPSVSSYVRDIAFTSPTLLSLLPAELATAVSDEQNQRRRAAAARGTTLAQYDPRAKVTSSSDLSVQILEADGQSAILLKREALGDFDGDGVEDMVLSVVNAMTRGTLRSTRLLVFTRKSATGPLQDITPEGFPFS